MPPFCDRCGRYAEPEQHPCFSRECSAIDHLAHAGEVRYVRVTNSMGTRVQVPLCVAHQGYPDEPCMSVEQHMARIGSSDYSTSHRVHNIYCRD